MPGSRKRRSLPGRGKRGQLALPAPPERAPGLRRSERSPGSLELRAPADAFFEAVQVNTDNQVVRRNRLNLLNRIRQTCLRVADLTRIEG